MTLILKNKPVKQTNTQDLHGMYEITCNTFIEKYIGRITKPI